jgi:alkylhydroperoxidase family enzyme
MENGLTEAKIAELDAPTNSFAPREQLALEFAERLALAPQRVDDGFFAELRAEFSDAEVLELGMMIGQYIGFGRLLKVLDLTPRFCPADGTDAI